MASKEKQVTPTDFINKWHSDTIKNKQALRNQDGSITTVNAVGVPLNGKIYLVPGYLRDGKVLNEQEAYTYWKDKIPTLEAAGALIGIEDNFVGELKDHPANKIAKENHAFMDSEVVPEDSVGFKP
tara:strand:- start:294 stop:671 length:378 start_codon:yes stop_codon:yes gene_type:complete